VRLALAGIVSTLVVAPAATAVVPFKASLKAPAAQPTVDVRWWYTVRVTNLAEKPIAARITVQIVDPFGGVYPVEFSWSQTKTITNWPFKGKFRDGIKFPPESRGFTLTIRYTLKAKIGGKTYKRILKRKVTPR
jgi:hypothetical protein